MKMSHSTLSHKMNNRLQWKAEDIEKAAAFFRVDAAALVAGQGFEPWTSGYVAMAVICVCRRSVYRVGSFKIVLFIMAVGMFSDERIEAI